MTAEIAVMNRQAVALAADSAVTVGVGPKVYNSANKLFALSDAHPVGVMVYGNAEMLGLPWETIIKVYRGHITGKDFGRLEDYAGNFLQFLKKEGQLFSSDWQAAFVHALALVFFGEIAKRVQKDVKEHQGKIGVRKIQGFATSRIEEQRREIEKAQRLPDAAPTHSKKVQKLYRKEITGALEQAFEKCPLLKASKAQLVSLVGELCSRQYFPITNSGIVIAGFGRKDLYPRLRSFVVEGMAADVLKYRVEVSSDIGMSTSAAIVPFAQTDMAYAFMEGITREYRERVEESVTGTLGYFVQEVIAILSGLPSEAAADLGQRLGDAKAKAIKMLVDLLRSYGREKYVLPVLAVVGILPKDELAAMAEALVNLTSFKRRMTMEAESVGGPIDVAVISKGDGLVWIKRKHYFRPELNPHFMARYGKRNEK
jgi:hypothetical protein